MKDLVLKHNAKKEKDMSSSNKLSYRWFGPYRIYKAKKEKGTYVLEELDGTRLPRTHTGNRLKKFVKHKGFYEPKKEMVETKGNEEKEIGDNNTRNKEFEIRLPTLTT